MNLLFVGLGLIGGSAAMASEGFAPDGRAARRTGVDIDEAVLKRALETGAVDDAYTPDKAEKAIAEANLIVLCLYPSASYEFLRENAKLIKRSAVVTDVCGVKAGFVEKSAALIPGAAYVGGHPMAGRELSGFSAALPTLFRGCNYIITPSESAEKSAVDLVSAFALYLGAGRIIYTDSETHDRNIAYTSQLAHVLAAAVVQNPLLAQCSGFEGGSLEDITRVAKLNSEMWSELFIENKCCLSTAIIQLEQSLMALRGLIESEDRTSLREQLKLSTQCKERWAASVVKHP